MKPQQRSTGKTQPGQTQPSTSQDTAPVVVYEFTIPSGEVQPQQSTTGNNQPSLTPPSTRQISIAFRISTSSGEMQRPTGNTQPALTQRSTSQDPAPRGEMQRPTGNTQPALTQPSTTQDPAPRGEMEAQQRPSGNPQPSGGQPQATQETASRREMSRQAGQAPRLRLRPNRVPSVPIEPFLPPMRRSSGHIYPFRPSMMEEDVSYLGPASDIPWYDDLVADSLRNALPPGVYPSSAGYYFDPTGIPRNQYRYPQSIQMALFDQLNQISGGPLAGHGHPFSGSMYPGIETLGPRPRASASPLSDWPRSSPQNLSAADEAMLLDAITADLIESSMVFGIPGAASDPNNNISTNKEKSGPADESVRGRSHFGSRCRSEAAVEAERVQKKEIARILEVIDDVYPTPLSQVDRRYLAARLMAGVERMGGVDEGHCQDEQEMRDEEEGNGAQHEHSSSSSIELIDTDPQDEGYVDLGAPSLALGNPASILNQPDAAAVPQAQTNAPDGDSVATAETGAGPIGTTTDAAVSTDEPSQADVASTQLSGQAQGQNGGTMKLGTSGIATASVAPCTIRDDNESQDANQPRRGRFFGNIYTTQPSMLAQLEREARELNRAYAMLNVATGAQYRPNPDTLLSLDVQNPGGVQGAAQGGGRPGGDIRICPNCKRNERGEEHLHRLVDEAGHLYCTQTRRFQCRLCGNRNEHSHMIKYSSAHGSVFGDK